MMPSLVFFDLDRTLAESKQAISPYIAELLGKLLVRINVAVISGGKFEQLKQQVIDQLPPGSNITNLYILPTSGAALYTFSEGFWHPVYEERLTDEQTQKVVQAMEVAMKETGLIDDSTPAYGERIETRGAQVTLSALGQEAPPIEKEKWDPTGSKKQMLHDALVPMLPEFGVGIGGATSIDVTLKGVDKAYGIRKLAAHRSYPLEDMLYVGDALYPGGNDEVVIATGIRTQPVRNPEDTARVIQQLLAL